VKLQATRPSAAAATRAKGSAGAARTKKADAASKGKEENKKDPPAPKTILKPKDVTDKEADTLMEAAALVAANGNRKLKVSAQYMEGIPDMVAALMPPLTGKQKAPKQPYVGYRNMFKRWQKQPERDMATASMQKVAPLLGQLVYIINPTHHPADRDTETVAHTTYTKDLALVTAPSATGPTAIVVWIIPTILDLDADSTELLFFADMSWNGGATKVAPQFLATAEKVDGLIPVDDGLWYAKDGSFHAKAVEGFDGEAYARGIEEEKALVAEKKRMEKEDQYIQDAEEYKKRMREDHDHAALDADKNVVTGKRQCIGRDTDPPKSDLQEDDIA
jgi:hypothetical protein